MVPLIVLAIAFVGLRIAARRGLRIARPCSVRFALAIMFVFTGVSHCLMPAQLLPLVPGWVPAPEATIYLSGLWELGLAALLISPVAIRAPRRVGAFVMGTLIALFPANVHGALAAVGAASDLGAHYLWLRAPAQLIYLGAAYYATWSDAAARAFSRLRAEGGGPTAA